MKNYHWLYAMGIGLSFGFAGHVIISFIWIIVGSALALFGGEPQEESV